VELVFELGQPLNDFIPLLWRNGYILLERKTNYSYTQAEQGGKDQTRELTQHGSKASLGKGGGGSSQPQIPLHSCSYLPHPKKSALQKTTFLTSLRNVTVREGKEEGCLIVSQVLTGYSPA